MLTIRSFLGSLVLSIFLALLAVWFSFTSPTVATTSWVLVVGGALIIAENWRAHDGGRSASFIFLVLGYLFLCGRAFAVLFAEESELQIVGFGSGFDVSPAVVAQYVLLVLTSFLCVHIGSTICKVKKSLSVVRSMATPYFYLFIALLPIYVYKNYVYFTYIMSHGGYLAIYQGADHLEEVGILPRVGALLCLSAFALYFFHEADQRRSRLALVFFVIFFSSELLVGLRGKFFVISLVFLLFYKLRFGGKFSAKTGLFLAAAVIALALSVEVFREQKTSSNVGSNILLGFLSQQGVTAGMVQYVMQDSAYFATHAWDYFLHQFFVPFYNQLDVPQGYFLANDVSMSLMPSAYALGFGTGSSYLAELVILGGPFGVIMASVFIGFILSLGRNFKHGVSGTFFFWLICGMVYYPRTMLHDPIHNLMRYALPTVLLVATVKVYEQLCLRNHDEI